MSQTRLRELLHDYVADEPPLRLTVAEIRAEADGPAAGAARQIRVGGRSRPLVPWIAAAASVAVVATAVGVAVTRGSRGPDGTPAVLGAGTAALGQRVPGSTPPGRMLDVLAEVARSLDPRGSVARSEATSWVPDDLGVPTVLAADRLGSATQWLVETAGAGEGLVIGAQVSARMVPPDALPADRVSPTCPIPASEVFPCVAGTLPDGRAFVERVLDTGVWTERPGEATTQRHAVTVIDGDIEITAAQVRTAPSGMAPGDGWSIPADTLRTSAADPRLVPPRPESVPPLPSYLACRVHPRPAGCPGATTSPDPSSSPPSPSAARAPLATVGAGEVVARMRTLVADVLGPGARGTYVVRSSASFEPLVAREYPWATSVSGDASTAADDRWLTVTITVAPVAKSGSVGPEGPLEPGVVEHRAWKLPDGRVVDYTVSTFGPDPQARSRVAARVDIADGPLSITVMETIPTTKGGPPPGRERLRLTAEQLVALATDPGLRLSAPVEWPDPVRGFCRPDARGVTVCTPLPPG